MWCGDFTQTSSKVSKFTLLGNWSEWKPTEAQGSFISSLFRTLLPIGKAVIKSTPSIIKSTARSPIGRKLKRSAKKLALDTAKNLIETGDIKKTLKKSVDDSKKEIADAFKSSIDSKKRKLSSSSHCRNKKKYHLMK